MSIYELKECGHSGVIGYKCEHCEMERLKARIAAMEGENVELYNTLQSITEDGHTDCEWCFSHVKAATKAILICTESAKLAEQAKLKDAVIAAAKDWSKNRRDFSTYEIVNSATKLEKAVAALDTQKAQEE